MNNPTRKWLVLTLLITAFPAVIGCDKRQDEKSREIVKIDSGQMILMGTFARILAVNEML
ncbi:MAG: hypothetical protein KAT56_08725 [Sedimentisphaerales bacterium]|nr:hypothetical protein [Sedimentisphaerales bacterium]